MTDTLPDPSGDGGAAPPDVDSRSNGAPRDGATRDGAPGDDPPSQGSTRDGSDDDGSTRGGSDDDRERNALEWVTFALGVAITLAVLGFLVYQMVAGSDEPADLVIELGAPDVRRGTALVPVTVRNEGDRVAEGAVVEVCAGPDDCAELSFVYVPQGSERTGEVGFGVPLAGPLETRVVSYRTL